ncbi:putative diacylglycerol O-acyltransferase [Mycobacterium marinum]|nr:putative diacylglycerol O-acyltransferase [Mycobacterium marinum]
MIAQLTTLDAGLRRAQEPDWDANLAIGAVAVINGAVPDFELLKTTLAQRLR